MHQIKHLAKGEPLNHINKKSLRRANRTPGARTPPRFEALTRHQSWITRAVVLESSKPKKEIS